MIDVTASQTLVCISDKNIRDVFLAELTKTISDSPQVAEDIHETKDILSTAGINLLIIECSETFVRLPKDLHHLTGKFKNLKVILLVLKTHPVRDAYLRQFRQIADLVINEDVNADEINQFLNPASTGNEKAVKPAIKTEKNVSSTLRQPVEQPANTAEPVVQEFDESELWTLFFEDSPTPMLIVSATSYTITHTNQALLDLLDKKESDITGSDWNQLDQPENYSNYDNYIKELTSSEKTSFDFEITSKESSIPVCAEYRTGIFNSEMVFLGKIVPAASQDIPSSLISLSQSIDQTDISSASAASTLEQIRSHFLLDFIFFFENKKDKAIKPTYAGNKRSIASVIQNSGQNFHKLLSASVPLKVNQKDQEIQQILDDNNNLKLTSFAFYPVEFKNCVYGAIALGSLHKIPNWRSLQLIIDLILSKYRLGLYQKNILEQKEIEGISDKLTGLPNRNAMTKKFAKLNKSGVEDGKYISLMIISLHKLNHLNKNLGIELTNQLIVSVAQIISKTVRSKGDVFRLSGDEFLVILKPHEQKTLIEALAKQILQNLKKPILLSTGDEQRVNINIGISIFPDDGQTVSSMMKNADLAMYDAKLAGLDNFVTFKHSETGKALKQKTQMEENLRKAITEGHIKVYYQPKIDAITEDIVGFEALVRWIDPLLGMINPGHFIPLAEETGLINQIGEYITKRTCENVIEWQKTFGLNLTCSINVSAIQLKDKYLPNKIEKIINSTGVLPQYIDFEITETIDIDTVPNLVNSLDAITRIGCTLSIDDFGTGHSSLDYVKRIPATYIKIDQTFVANIGLNPEDEAILDATISIAKRLNRKLIAEGVETEQQREYLLERKCEYFQGFLFSRPLPEDEINRLLEERAQLMG